MKLKGLIILVLAFVLWQAVGEYAQAEGKRKVNTVTRYELWWRIQQKTGTQLQLLCDGEDASICRGIEASLETTIESGGGKDIQVKLAACGILKLFHKNGVELEIDITDIGFFPGKGRWLNQLFYSEELVGIIKKMTIDCAKEKGKHIDQSFFERINKEFMKQRTWFLHEKK